MVVMKILIFFLRGRREEKFHHSEQNNLTIAAGGHGSIIGRTQAHWGPNAQDIKQLLYSNFYGADTGNRRAEVDEIYALWTNLHLRSA